MDKTICTRCKEAGSKGLVPYKIIYDVDGQSVKFVGQLCTKCYKEIFEEQEKEDKVSE